MDARLKSPFSMIICGPSASGKTTKLSQILKNRDIIFETPPEKICLYYKVWQPAYSTFLKLKYVDHFVEGIPTQSEAEDQLKKTGHKVLIFDDLSTEVNAVVEYLFTIGSHHHNTSIILLTQNLFCKNVFWRSISLNCMYFLLMKNPRDSSQIASLGRQIFPGQKNYLTSICKYLSIFKSIFSILLTKLLFFQISMNVTQPTPVFL